MGSHSCQHVSTNLIVLVLQQLATPQGVDGGMSWSLTRPSKLRPLLLVRMVVFWRQGGVVQYPDVHGAGLKGVWSGAVARIVSAIGYNCVLTSIQRTLAVSVEEVPISLVA